LQDVLPHEASHRSYFAGCLWFGAVLNLRTLARGWFTELQDKHLLSLVTLFSSLHVCGLIAANELSAAALVYTEGLTLKG
jgi:hypothetical protein